MTSATRAPAPLTVAPNRHVLNIVLWVVQLMLALLFAGSGFTKAVTPLAALAQSLPYTADLPAWLVRFIGVSEVAGAVGLLLPALTGIKPTLTPWAAVGLATIMALAAFVAWGRLMRVPLRPR